MDTFDPHIPGYNCGNLQKHNESNRVFNVLEEQLVVYSTSTRISLLTVNSILTFLAILGNLFVLFTMINRKTRYFYKSCLISLAMADLMIAIFTGAQHIDGLSEADYTWKLGEFMCHFIPFDQIVSLLANSFSLTCIALDRYISIIKAMQLKWDPKRYTSILVICIVWFISAVIAYPMWNSYEYTKYNVFAYTSNTSEVNQIGVVYRCNTSSKIFSSEYFACLLAFIFVPLLCTFLYMYISIAILVWKRQKPLTNNQISVTNTTLSNDQSQSTSKKQTPKDKPEDKIETIAYGSCTIKKSSLQRNRRTFTILMILISIFFLCNLPTFIVMFLEMFNVWDSKGQWIWVSIVHLLPMCSSVLNPIFYTFLNETISYTKQLRKNGGLFCCQKKFNARKNLVVIIAEHQS